MKSMNWQTICEVDEIPRNGARCALLGNHQIAVFRVVDGEVQKFFALDNHDPFSGANVLSRGIVGSLQDKLVVASPVYKQHFCLDSGACLEENIQLRTWPVRIHAGNVQLAS